MAIRRKRVRLTANKKLEVIQRIYAGESHENVAKRYGIGISTVYIIVSEREKIINFIEKNTEATNSTTKVITNSQLHSDFNRLLRQWYIRCALKEITLTEAMVRKKAVQLNNQLTGGSTFKASLRWVQRYMKCHFLSKKNISKELETPNQAAADSFKAEFHALMQKEEYKLENVYNAEITRLRWKTIPESTLLSKKLKRLESRMGNKKVTIFLCTNATGSHKLPVLVIGMEKDSPTISAFYANILSIMYQTRTDPFMDSDIFNEWFHDCFLKLVIERQQKGGQREKTLLLVNNAGLDHETRIISTRDEFIKIMHFFYDAAPLIQPMDCGIIACFKRMYRKTFLDFLMPRPDGISEKQIAYTYSNFQIDSCCCMVHTAWVNVNNSIIKKAWDKLLDNESEQSSQDSEIIKKDINDVLEKLKRMPGCEGCDSISVMNWFETEKKNNINQQVDINNALLDFIRTNTEMETLTDDDFVDILDDTSS